MSEHDPEGEPLQKVVLSGNKTISERRQRESAQRLAEQRHELLSRTSLSPAQIKELEGVTIKTIRQAWFTLSHLLLEPGAMIAVMGSGEGDLAYAMAVMKPEFHIIGLDYDKTLMAGAKKKWKRDNLEFIISKVTKPSFPNNSLDAVVDSFTLHEVYSRQGFTDSSINTLLSNHFALLKHNGTLLLQDYIHPPPGEYVMLEFPDVASVGDEPEDLSEADLLVRFSEQARGGDLAGHGFFLEELEPYIEGTRLFRLPYKWAYEFIFRKDRRDFWQEELKKEYAFMTARELRKTIRNLGARLTYAAPYWDQTTIRNHYEGKFRIYDDNGLEQGYPITSHIFIARKVDIGESMALQERRPSRRPIKNLTIKAVHNTVTGEIMDLVARETEVVEFLPYRIDENGKLFVFLHDGVSRAVTNAVPRSGRNIDQKRWSGHMVEALGVDRMILADYDTIWTPESTRDFARRNLGLKPHEDAIMEEGPEFYPDPRMIDERIETKFLHVEKPRTSLTPRWAHQITQTFSDKGKVKEFEAQQVLNAITVGLIPSSRLERQILALFSLHGLSADNWSDSPLHLDEIDTKTPSFEDLTEKLKSTKKTFKPTQNFAGDMRSIHSYFVDEGITNGVMTGIAARDIEFVIKEQKTINTAVVLPLAKSLSGEVLAGYVEDYLPVPERYGKSGKTIRAPSFNLPPDVQDMNMARAYVAEQFGVNYDRVVQLGESYFVHNGITPQRIFPFAVTEDARGSVGPGGTFTEYAPIRWLWALVWHLFEESFAVTIKKAIERMHGDIDFGVDKSLGMDFGQESARTLTPPPYGLPIPSSLEEHQAAALEYQSASGSNSGEGKKGEGSGAKGTDAKDLSDEERIAQAQKRIEEFKRKDMYVDYSDIDGDNFSSRTVDQENSQTSQNTNNVVSILRTPPGRKKISQVAEKITPFLNVPGHEQTNPEEDLEHTPDNPKPSSKSSSSSSSSSSSTGGSGSGGDTGSSSSSSSSDSSSGDNQGSADTQHVPDEPEYTI